MSLLGYSPIIQRLHIPDLSVKDITVSVLRLDLIHEQVSGNKWFKLKYNIKTVREAGLNTILTFGGAFSNHILATAAACRLAGIKAIGIIRAEKESASNPTLSKAQDMGMQLHFVSREEYKEKNTAGFISKLAQQFGKFYLVPEGGSNYEGALGCKDILENITGTFNYVFCACGTGTTFAGLAAGLEPEQTLVGISVLKGEQSMLNEAQELVNRLRKKQDLRIGTNEELLQVTHLTKTGILNSYTFGGYAKHTGALLAFKAAFEDRHHIPLDYVYTAKLFYAVFDLICRNKIPNGSKILIVHSGGLQGNAGYEQRYALKPMRMVSDAQGKDCLGLIP